MEKQTEEKVAYLCRTLEDAQDLIYQCIQKDYNVWRTSNWDVYKDKTCFSIENGKVSYSSIDYYTREEYRIIEFQKGDVLGPDRWILMKGEGHCKCEKCNNVSWTSMCYRLNDRTNKYHAKVICSICRRKIMAEE